jgi:hypothetical protein
MTPNPIHQCCGLAPRQATLETISRSVSDPRPALVVSASGTTLGALNASAYPLAARASMPRSWRARTLPGEPVLVALTRKPVINSSILRETCPPADRSTRSHTGDRRHISGYHTEDQVVTERVHVSPPRAGDPDERHRADGSGRDQRQPLSVLQAVLHPSPMNGE